MATAVSVQTTGFTYRVRRYKPRVRHSQKMDWVCRPGAAREEARILIAMMRRTGASIEDTRELIEVPQEQEAALRLYARTNPEDAGGIEKALSFRKRVAQEFERLVHSFPVETASTTGATVGANAEQDYPSFKPATPRTVDR